MNFTPPDFNRLTFKGQGHSRPYSFCLSFSVAPSRVWEVNGSNQAVTDTVRPVTVSIWVPSAMVRMLVAVLR